MLWYAVQTYTGREEELVNMIRRMLPEECYGECFVPCFEQLRRWHQQNQVRVLRLFPSYIFLSTDDINVLFQRLKKIPAMSKIVAADEFEFTPLYEDEAGFLMGIMDAERVVRLTYVETDGRGHVSRMTGPLEKCRDHIRKYQFHRRYAMVGLTVAGQEKTARLGIILSGDVQGHN